MIYRSKIERKCIICGKNFHPSRKEYFTCSVKCGCQIRKGKNAPIKKRTIICDNCGNRFLRLKSKIRYKHHFCGMKCYAKYKQKIQIKNKNSNWKGGISLKNLARHGKGNRLYRKGKYYENLVRKELEKNNYYTIRSGASKGIWDIVAINSNHIRLIQVKTNACPNPKERKKMEEFNCSNNISKEYWRFYGRGKKEIWVWKDRKEWKKERIE